MRTRVFFTRAMLTFFISFSVGITKFKKFKFAPWVQEKGESTMKEKIFNKSGRLPSRILALCLCVCMLFGVVYINSTANAAETQNTRSVMLGTNGLSGWNSTDGYDYLYYGTYNGSSIKWRVLDDQTNTGGSGLYLMSDAILKLIDYDNENIDTVKDYYDGEWNDSSARIWCTNLLSNAFSSTESSAILSTTKTDNAFTYNLVSTYGTYVINYLARSNNLNNDKIFLLSAEEANNAAYGFVDDASRIGYYNSTATNWWLRSPKEDNSSSYSGAGLINNKGQATGTNYYLIQNSGLDTKPEYGMRPAFNLSTSNILFTSAATGTNTGFGIVGSYTGNEWKATFLDSARRFSVTETTAAAPSGGEFELNYNGANTGSNEYVSAMLVDGNGNVLCYGQIASNSASGKATVTLPLDIAAGTYQLKVFSEQKNGDYKTDIASAFDTVELTIEPPVNLELATFKHSLIFGDYVALNYYVTFDASATSPENSTVEFVYADGTKLTVSPTLDENGAVKTSVLDGKLYYTFRCPIDAKEMTDTITATVKLNGAIMGIDSYSVEQHAVTILEMASTPEKDKTMVKATLTYGAAAQTYFGYKLDALATRRLIDFE